MLRKARWVHAAAVTGRQGQVQNEKRAAMERQRVCYVGRNGCQFARQSPFSCQKIPTYSETRCHLLTPQISCCPARFWLTGLDHPPRVPSVCPVPRVPRAGGSGQPGRRGGKLRTQLRFSALNFLPLSVEAGMLNQKPFCVCDRISFVYCEKLIFKGEKIKMESLTRQTLQSWHQEGIQVPQPFI